MPCICAEDAQEADKDCYRCIPAEPPFWDYCVLGKCHWLVAGNLWVAQQAWPDRPWRIVSTAHHTTVWDGYKLIFDLTYLALEVPVKECWECWLGKPMGLGTDRRCVRSGDWTVCGKPRITVGDR